MVHEEKSHDKDGNGSQDMQAQASSGMTKERTQN